jgi:hypothetical protein
MALFKYIGIEKIVLRIGENIKPINPQMLFFGPSSLDDNKYFTKMSDDGIREGCWEIISGMSVPKKENIEEVSKNYAIAISTYFGKQDEIRFAIFKECIDSLLKTNFYGKIYIVDDGSVYKGHISYVTKLNDDRICIHEKEENSGIAKNKNTGLLLMYNDPNVHIGFLSDDDMIFNDKDWHENYIRAMNNTGIHHFSYALPSISKKTGKEVEVNGYKVLKTTQVDGCLLVTSRSLIERIGFFRIFPYKYGHEHSNFSIRCMQLYRGLYDIIDSEGTVALNDKSIECSSIDVNEDQKIENEKFLHDYSYQPLIV